MKSINFLICLLVLSACIATSCSQHEMEPVGFNENIEVDIRIPPEEWLDKLVIIIVALSPGHHVTTTTTDPDGTETTKTSCEGIGFCLQKGSVVDTGDDLSSNGEQDYDGDFSSLAYLSVNANGNVVVGMDESSDPMAKETFFYDDIIYASPSYVIDNPDVLMSLGLVEPVLMEEGEYEVFEEAGMQYIIIQ